MAMDRPRKGQGDSKRNPSSKDNYRYLRLIWTENDSDNDYTLKYHLSDPGLWILAEPKKGFVGKWKIYFSLKINRNQLFQI